MAKTVVLAIALGVAAILGCASSPSPAPGAGQWDVVAAYGKPHYQYTIEDEYCMEWHLDGAWIRRCYFTMKNRSDEATKTIRYALVLTETRLNWGHEFFR